MDGTIEIAAISARTPTGLSRMSEVPWGSHLCQFFADGADLRETLVPYFKAGLENNERCLMVTMALSGSPRPSEIITERSVENALRVLLGCDLTGFTDFDSLVRCMVESKQMLWALMYEVVDDERNEVCRRDHRREGGL